MQTIGIIGAMEKEIALIRANLKNLQEVVVAGGTYLSGQLGRQQVVLTCSGIGKVNAAISAIQIFFLIAISFLKQGAGAYALSPGLVVISLYSFVFFGNLFANGTRELPTLISPCPASTFVIYDI